MTQRLRDLLEHCPPLDSLPPEVLDRAAADAVTERYRPGQLVLDAFAQPPADVYLVLDGEVSLSVDPDELSQTPQERIGRGGLFGFSALLNRDAMGPRAVAATEATVARIPGSLVSGAFLSETGAHFLAGQLQATSRLPMIAPSFLVVDDLIEAPPLVVEPSTPVAEVARLMTEQHWPCAAVRVGPGRYGLISQSRLLRRIVVEGRSGDTPAEAVMRFPVTSVESGTSTVDALSDLIDEGTEFLPVLARSGDLVGMLDWRDFVLSAPTVGIPTRDEIRRAADIEELVERGRRVPQQLGPVLHRGLASGRVIATYSAIVDAMVRRAVVLVFAEHPELSTDAFTWLSLGSNGRREAAPGSDLDAAVAFAADVEPAEQERYRAVFAEVMDVLARAGIGIDTHGVTPARAAFSRTNAEWRRAGLRWLARPEENKGAIMGSLLVDARPIHGDPGLPEVLTVFGDFRRHPATVRLVLDLALSARARVRSVRDVLSGRGSELDLKAAALLPVVNMARWAALAAGSAELHTTSRLRAAAGSRILPTAQAAQLIEVFDVLQHLRLQYQISEIEAGRRPTDVLRRDRLSRIDRATVKTAVREIGAIQVRMARTADYLGVDQLVQPDDTQGRRTRP